MTSRSTFDAAHAAHGRGYFRKAFTLFEMGAEAGDVDCMLQLGVMYTCGEGVACDYNKAVAWERKAIESGSTLALLNLGITYRIKGELRQARHWFERALDAGDAEAALELGKLYLVSDLEVATVRKYLKMVLLAENVCEASREEAESLLEELA